MTIGEIIANAISILSLIVAYLGYRKTRKTVTVDFAPSCYFLDPKKDIISSDNLIHGVKATRALYTTIDIVNSSSVNMAYMDLRAFDPISNANHFIATYKSLPFLQNQNLLLSPFGPNSLDNFAITLPDRIFAPLPAGSYTSIDVLIFINDNVDTSHGVMVSIKTTETTFFKRSPYSDTNRKKFKAYNFLYDIKKSGTDSKSQPPLPITKQPPD